MDMIDEAELKDGELPEGFEIEGAEDVDAEALEDEEDLLGKKKLADEEESDDTSDMEEYMSEALGYENY